MYFFFLSSNLNGIDKVLHDTKENARIYNENFGGLRTIRTIPTGRRNDYWFYILLVDKRDKFAEYMGENGIAVSNSCLVLNNNCAENGVTNGAGAGILILGRGSRIENNNLTGNYHGIKALKGGNRIENNNVSDNLFDGINLSSSDNNNLSGNIVLSNNNNGINLVSSDNNNLSYNNVSSNSDKGLHLLSNSEFNIIEKSNFSAKGTPVGTASA